MTSESKILAQAALDYISAGLHPIPLHPRSKKPVGDEWQNLRVTQSDVPLIFSEQGNIGVLLGEPSANLVDLDLDSPEAVALAPHFLPLTTYISGRESKLRSHHWYLGVPVPEHKKFEFAGECLLELRTVGQTMVPPSIHPSGEQMIWHDAKGDLPSFSADELSHAAAELAAAALLVRQYPATGSRHEFALALSGFLLRQRWDSERVRYFVSAVATAAGDDEVEDRQRAVDTTAQRIAADENILGGTRLNELLDRAVFEKVCEWLGFGRSRFDVLPIVEAATVAPEVIPPWPEEALEGDYIADLTFQLFTGTAIPPQFLRESCTAVLGSLIEGKVGFPAHRNLSVRRYLALVSERAQAGKGESWKRVVSATGEGGALRPLVESIGVKVLNGTAVGSGQFLAKLLQENSRAIVHWDEASHLFETGGQQNATLFSALKTLFESNELFTGSFTNKMWGGEDLHLSVLLHATRKIFTGGFALRGGVGDGLLSRFTLAYVDRPPIVPTWEARNLVEERKIVERITELIPKNFVQLGFDDAANARMTDFARSLLSHDHPNLDHVRRLLELVKTDALIRCVFSGGSTISREMMDRSILWGQHQLSLRLALWPSDAGNRVEAITQILLRRLRKGSASAADLRNAANVSRDGSHENFSRALSALKRSGALVVLGKNRKNQEIYGLDEERSDGTV